MENVYFFTRLHGWEPGIISHFKEKELWKNVFVSERYISDEFFFKDEYIEEYLPKELFDRMVPYISRFMDMHLRTHATGPIFPEQFNYHDLLNLFSIYGNAYYNFYKKEQIDLFIINCAPHIGFDLVAYLVAHFMGIKTLILEQTHFSNRYFIYTDFYDYGDFKTSKKLFEFPSIEIENKFEKRLAYMDMDEISLKNKAKNFYKYNPLVRMLFQFRHKELRGKAIYRYQQKKAFERNFTKYNRKVDLSQKFVYFALHLQPEKTTSAWGGDYVDQLLALERLSEYLPDDVMIYVKENPKQDYNQRGKFFYKRLRSIKKVILVPNDMDTYELIRNSLFVATITGTVGWEAITGGKPCLIFGWGTWYKSLPGVFYFDDQPDYEDLINCRINHQELEEKLNRLLATTGKGVIFPIDYYKGLVEGFSEEQNTWYVVESLERFLGYCSV